MSALTPPADHPWLPPLEDGLWRRLRDAHDAAEAGGRVLAARLLGDALLGDSPAVDAALALHDADGLWRRTPGDHAVRRVLASCYSSRNGGPLHEGGGPPAGGCMWLVGWTPAALPDALHRLDVGRTAAAIHAPDRPAAPLSVPALLGLTDLPRHPQGMALASAALESLRAHSGVLGVPRWTVLGPTGLDAAALLRDAQQSGWRVWVTG